MRWRRWSSSCSIAENRPDWNRLAIDRRPGDLGDCRRRRRAPARVIGHDFCAISLSDLLTPWPDIERRLRAAADGDFVVALYNPVSQRRRTQLRGRPRHPAGARPPETPVVLARNLGRAGESVSVIELEALTPSRSTC